jgi:hypothetical protein
VSGKKLCYTVDLALANWKIKDCEPKHLFSYQKLQTWDGFDVEEKFLYDYHVWDFRFWENLEYFSFVERAETKEILMYVWDGHAPSLYSFFVDLSLVVRHRVEVTASDLAIGGDLALVERGWGGGADSKGALGLIYKGDRSVDPFATIFLKEEIDAFDLVRNVQVWTKKIEMKIQRIEDA